MPEMIDRKDFRKVVKEVVRCVRHNLDVPGVRPLDAKQLLFWLQNITLEDLEIVVHEIEADKMP